MAQDFQSSFIPSIPTDPITQKAFKKKKTSILEIIAVTLFVVALLLAVGMYVYKIILRSSIESLQAELAVAEQNIDKETINEMAKFSGKLGIVRSIIIKHQVISNFLEILAANTVSSVYFTSFNYGGLKPNELSVTMQGKAANYASLALQSDVFSKNKNFKSVDFSGLDLSEGGLVSFNLAISVDPQISVFNIPAEDTSLEDISSELDELEDINLDIPDL